jgi:hypothetical protein
MTFPLMPFPLAPELPAPTVEYTHLAASSSNLFTYTFNGCNIGTASTDRIVVVCAMINATSSTTYGISSVTINGSAATLAVNSSLGKNSAIFYLLVPTGTTANVVVNLSGSGTPGRCVAGIFSVKGYTNATPEVVGSAYSDTNVASLSVPINVSSGAAAIACCYVGNNGTSGASWTSPMVEAFDTPIESTTFTAASTTLLPRGVTSVEITPPISIDMSMSVAVWR